MKTCTKCGIEKSLDDFHKAKQARDGRRSRCKDCCIASRREYVAANLEHVRSYARQYQRARKGVQITPEQAELMAAEQGHACAMCKRPEAELGRRLHLDHDHETGQIRELLCGSCNRGLGYLQDNPDLLRGGADYIERHKACAS
jgi:hypothetical protein